MFFRTGLSISRREILVRMSSKLGANSAPQRGLWRRACVATCRSLALGVVLLFVTTTAWCVAAEDETGPAEVREQAGKYAQAFNQGKPADVAAFFSPKGEFIDESGTVYQGRKEVQTLLTTYFEKFPGVKLMANIETLRAAGPLVIEEGVRTMETADKGAAKLRYIAIWTKTNAGWQMASLRDFSETPVITANETLQGLAWLVGDWLNEGSDNVVKISYRWSEDKNFLLGDYHVTQQGKVVMKSSQRIGFDPVAGKIRSWLFDSDGGFGESSWTQVGEEWVLKSTATLPDGQQGSATITISAKDKNRFTMKGTDRLVGVERAPDFDVTVVRQVPKATAK
ncbi:MAG: YybH family protein [Planctomycetota bacterium]